MRRDISIRKINSEFDFELKSIQERVRNKEKNRKIWLEIERERDGARCRKRDIASSIKRYGETKN